jgi:hypothetical protein
LKPLLLILFLTHLAWNRSCISWQQIQHSQHSMEELHEENNLGFGCQRGDLVGWWRLGLA